MFKNSILIGGCKFNCDKDTLVVTLRDNSIVNKDDFEYVLNKSNSNRILINNICDIKVFKDLLKLVRKIDFDKEIDINIGYKNEKIKNNTKPLIQGLNNKTYIDLNNIPDNVKLSCMGNNNEQNELITWAHNLNDNNKALFLNLMSNDDKISFLEQERVISEFYKEITSLYPNIMEIPKKERFNTVYDYFIQKYKYEESENDFEIELDPIKTYEKGRGGSTALSNLLTLVTNNSLLRLNCTVVNGKYNGIKHSWNQFIDENNNISDYDMYASIKDCNSIRDMKYTYNHQYERVYPCIIELEDGEKGDLNPVLRRNKINLGLIYKDMYN